MAAVTYNGVGSGTHGRMDDYFTLVCMVSKNLTKLMVVIKVKGKRNRNRNRQLRGRPDFTLTAPRLLTSILAKPARTIYGPIT